MKKYREKCNKIKYLNHRDPPISTINKFLKFPVLRKFRAKRGQKTMVVQVMRENSKIISVFLPLFVSRDKIKQDDY